MTFLRLWLDTYPQDFFAHPLSNTNLTKLRHLVQESHDLTRTLASLEEEEEEKEVERKVKVISNGHNGGMRLDCCVYVWLYACVHVCQNFSILVDHVSNFPLIVVVELISKTKLLMLTQSCSISYSAVSAFIVIYSVFLITPIHWAFE